MTERNPWDEIAALAEPMFGLPMTKNVDYGPCQVLTVQDIGDRLGLPSDFGVEIVGSRVNIEIPFRTAEPIGFKVVKVRR